MEEHAVDVLRFSLWVIGALGGLIVILLGTIAGLARWGGVELFKRLSEQDRKMDAFQSTIASKSDEIKDLLSSEVRMLREEQHGVRERVVKLEAFKDQMQAVCNFGRRHSDHQTGD